MTKEKPNKWTRERSFLEINSGDIMMLFVALFFLALMVGGFYVFIFQPSIPGLSEAFKDPPPPRIDRPLHLAPGETEMKLYPAKPPGKPNETPKKK